MRSLPDWLPVAAGLVLVLTGVREVFHTLLHPGGIGVLTPRVFRHTWRAGKRLGLRGRSLAGPLAIVLSSGAWTLLMAVGFALVYLPSMPRGFVVSDGVPAGGSFLDALYVSVTALSTLGVGDIVAERAALRLAVVTEALIGFALLTAAISWILSIAAAVGRRRTFAARLRPLVPGGRLAVGGPPAAQAVVLHDLAAGLAELRVDLFQQPSSYFFHAPHEQLSLAATLPHLHEALAADPPAELAEPVRALREAVDGLAEALRDGPFPLGPGTTAEVLEAYAADHRR